MEREVVSIKRKAVKINLENSIYGTFAEIGAGQEVARTFFQVGGASGTIAKTMSAYDMTFSDSIYGEEGSGRYVSESRVKRMLAHEYELVENRLTDDKYVHRRFFAFADTCTTINYHRNNDPHCWMGLRFQLVPQGPVNEVIMHVRLKENDALLQQRTIGGLGVNLIYACYWYAQDMDAFVGSLMDNLTTDQAEIDMLRLTGADFASVDNRLLALMLVKKAFTSGTIFGPDKEVYQPKDILYKRNILCLRGRFRPVTKVSEDMFNAGVQTFKECFPDCQNDQLLALSELTINNLEANAGFDDKDFLDRTDVLCSLGHTVMISNCQKHDTLLAYLRRCRPKNIGVVIGVMNLMELLNEDHYADPQSEILHYFGEIFQRNTKMLVYPYQPTADAPLITLENYPISESLTHLFAYLKACHFLIDVKGYDPALLQIFSNNVIQMIKSGEEGWEQYVPDFVAEYIKARCLFDYPCEVKH
ncbi:MAG: TonB-dependent receptor [Bacteroidetes bacterium]|nr:TonB-dependent receptor [Bacteroidota bacterium]